MNEIAKIKISNLNKCLNNHLIEHVQNKKVLLDLSGGHDTRVNLSILLKNSIPFGAITYNLSYGDIKISSKICKKFGIRQHITTRDNVRAVKNKLKWDINICGAGYNEWMCVLHKVNKSMKQIEEHNNTKKRFENRQINPDIQYTPMIEDDVINVIKEIPICYLAGGYIQKSLIALNCPDLLKFPFTYYDFRHLLMNKFHRRIVDSLYKSYYVGVCNNPYEDKRVKE